MSPLVLSALVGVCYESVESACVSLDQASRMVFLNIDVSATEKIWLKPKWLKRLGSCPNVITRLRHDAAPLLVCMI